MTHEPPAILRLSSEGRLLGRRPRVGLTTASTFTAEARRLDITIATRVVVLQMLAEVVLTLSLLLWLQRQHRRLRCLRRRNTAPQWIPSPCDDPPILAMRRFVRLYDPGKHVFFAPNLMLQSQSSLSSIFCTCLRHLCSVSHHYLQSCRSLSVSCHLSSHPFNLFSKPAAWFPVNLALRNIIFTFPVLIHVLLARSSFSRTRPDVVRCL